MTDAPKLSFESQIRNKLTAAFQPTHLEVVNESHMHNVPKGSETHFRVIIVSNAFAGVSRVERSRKVHDVLKEELAGGVHALSHRTYTPEEWRKTEGKVAESPECLGGNKK